MSSLQVLMFVAPLSACYFLFTPWILGELLLLDRFCGPGKKGLIAARMLLGTGLIAGLMTLACMQYSHSPALHDYEVTAVWIGLGLWITAEIFRNRIPIRMRRAFIFLYPLTKPDTWGNRG